MGLKLGSFLMDNIWRGVARFISRLNNNFWVSLSSTLNGEALPNFLVEVISPLVQLPLSLDVSLEFVQQDRGILTNIIVTLLIVSISGYVIPKNKTFDEGCFAFYFHVFQ